MKPLVSLIMPVWRPRPDWLREAVASALDDETSLELLVVDDGCEEPVESLLRGIEDERLKVLRVGHGGPYAARNAGLRAAVGSYVRFVDCDDVIETGSTLRLLELADGRDDVVAYGATMMCDEALEPLRLVTSTLEGDVAPACLLGEFHVYVVSMLFPSAVLARAGEWEEQGFRVSGDWDYVLRAVEHASVRRLDAVVTRYRRHGDSISSSADVAVGAEAGRLVLGAVLRAASGAERHGARAARLRATPPRTGARSRLARPLPQCRPRVCEWCPTGPSRRRRRPRRLAS